MLVKVGLHAVVNVTAFDKVWIEMDRQETERNSINSLSYPMTYYKLYFKYEDLNGNPAEVMIDCGTSGNEAIIIKDEIVSQIREVEMENATQALETAMKEANNGS